MTEAGQNGLKDNSFKPHPLVGEVPDVVVIGDRCYVEDQTGASQS